MKKCFALIGIGALCATIVGVMCMRGKKEKKCGVRHAAQKLMSGVNDFLDELGLN